MLAPLLMVVAIGQASVGVEAGPGDAPTYVPGGARWGTAGAHRVVAGHAWPRRGFGLTVGGMGSWAEGVVVPTDKAQAYQGYLDIIYQPIAKLELGLGGRVDFFSDSAFLGSRVLRIGSPEVMVKYAFTPLYKIATALVARAYFPVVEARLAASHPAVGLAAAASYDLAGRWEFSLNVGAAYDNTGGAVSGWRNPAQKIADGLIYTHYAHAGISAQAAWQIEAGFFDTVTLVPFAEATGEFGLHTSIANDPTRLTLGLKTLLFADRPVEIMLGLDRRITGAASMTSPFPGELPWSLLLRFALHIDRAEPTRGRVVTIDNSRVTYLPGGTAMISSADGPQVHAVTVRGHVYDVSHQPISEGTVVIDHRNGAPLALEPDGSFSTLPVVVEGNVLHVEARALGYQSSAQNIMLDANQTDARVTFELPLNLDTSIVRGTIFNKHTGKPLPRASVFIPELNNSPFQVDANGAFALPLRDGHYQVIFAAPGFASVKRQLVTDSEVRVILHIGLSHRLPSVLRR